MRNYVNDDGKLGFKVELPIAIRTLFQIASASPVFFIVYLGHGMIDLLKESTPPISRVIAGVGAILFMNHVQGLLSITCCIRSDLPFSDSTGDPDQGAGWAG